MSVDRFDPSDESEPGADTAVDDESIDRGGPEAVRRLRAELEELAEYARLYLAARGDAILASLRRLGLWIVAALLGLLILSAMLVTAAVIGILGVAQLLGQALGERLWAGYLVTGFGLLLITALAMLTAIFILRRKFRNQTVRKYARRHEQQKARFGHDVIGRTAARQSERS